MIQNTDNKPLSELFSADNKIVYHIPKYQREYIWNKLNWEALFDDVEESEGGHFLGSIICINTQKDSHKPAELELVDGQQRMTTISLFYLAIYKYLLENIPDANNFDYQLKLHSLKNRITLADSKSIRLIPSLSGFNLDDYKFLFSDVIKDLKILTKPRNFGNRKLSKAFNYFYNRLNDTDDDGNPNYNFQEVERLLEKFSSATLVKIDVASHADAFVLFETLNNRGVPLSAIDLIKNKLLGHLEKVMHQTNLDDNFDRWNQIITNLTDDYTIQERFLRQFYNAFSSLDEVNVAKKPKALKSNLIYIYEVLINRDVNEIFTRLEEASQIYSKHITYEIEEHSKELIISLRNLENVNGSDGYMLLLYVVKRFNITNSEKTTLVDLLCNYFIRRNVTDSPPTRDLTNYFMNIIKEIHKLKEYSFEDIKKIIIAEGKPASDELFKQKLNGNLYEENVGATRYILSTIELFKTATKEKNTNFYQREKKLFIWSIEHIFPQGDNIPVHWVDMIANGNKAEAETVKKDYVHKLGNLTLTGYNSQLSNMAFSDKLDKKDKEGKYIGFRNGLYLNTEIENKKAWTKKDIIDRTDALVKLSLQLFKI